MRERIEEFGAPEISDVDCKYLSAVKQSMAAFNGASILLGVFVCGQLLGGDPVGQFVTFACVLGGAYEAVVRTRLYKESCMKAFGAYAKSMAVGFFWAGFTATLLTALGWTVDFGGYQLEAGAFANPRAAA